MIKERKQKYLVPKNQMLFLKEAQANKSVYQEYGWKNTGTIFKNHLISYLVEWLKEVVEEDIDDDGVVKRNIMVFVEFQIPWLLLKWKHINLE